MLRRNFLKLAAFLAVPTPLFGKQEKTGYIPNNAIKTEEKAAQELYRQFKKKDDFGCKTLNLSYFHNSEYNNKKWQQRITCVGIHWYTLGSVSRDESNNYATLNMKVDCACVAIDYIPAENVDKITSAIKKRFSEYKVVV